MQIKSLIICEFSDYTAYLPVKMYIFWQKMHEKFANAKKMLYLCSRIRCA